MVKQYESPSAVAPPGAPSEPAQGPPPPPPAPQPPMMRGPDNATLVIGGLLVLLGALLLVGQTVYLPVDWSRYGWPLFVIAAGLALFALMAVGGKSSSGLAIPASIVTVTGIILFVQNVADLWETWSYAWALIFPTAVGLGQWIQGVWTEQRSVQQRGRNTMATGVVLFLVFAAFFEGVLGISNLGASEVVRTVLPAALIVAGVLLIVSHAAGRQSTS